MTRIADNSKTNEGRVLALDCELWKIMSRHWALREYEKQNKTIGISLYVFHQNGKPIGEFRKSWARVCVSAGLGKMVCPKCGNEGKTNTCSTCKNVTLYSGRTFHDFRRTAVRNMIRAGVPEPVAMAISGHKTRATFDRYNIVNEEVLRRAMERTEAYLKGPLNRV